jgi:hypothetical protein
MLHYVAHGHICKLYILEKIMQQLQWLDVLLTVIFSHVALEPAHSICCGPLPKKVGHSWVR